MSFLDYLLASFALVLVIEGLLYALFTESVRKMMALALTLPPEKLRIFGMCMAIIGFLLLWIVPKL
ncbi:MAG: DUF2065 domain-containing protein [Micavibrio sp.]